MPITAFIAFAVSFPLQGSVLVVLWLFLAPVIVSVLSADANPACRIGHLVLCGFVQEIGNPSCRLINSDILCLNGSAAFASQF